MKRMRFRKNVYFNIGSKKTCYGIEAKEKDEWLTCCEKGAPLVFTAKAKRDAKMKALQLADGKKWSDMTWPQYIKATSDNLCHICRKKLGEKNRSEHCRGEHWSCHCVVSESCLG